MFSAKEMVWYGLLLQVHGLAWPGTRLSLLWCGQNKGGLTTGLVMVVCTSKSWEASGSEHNPVLPICWWDWALGSLGLQGQRPET